METIQIEITNACHNKCSNCTRLVGHHPKSYFMDFEAFKQAVDSMEHYPVARPGQVKIIGVMGGEPLLHPEFEKFCEYLSEKEPAEHCGLWTCFPKGKEHYREVIAKTFGHIFLNDQSRGDILHGPILVASQELDIEQWFKDYLINQCWVQNSWSASINPKGAFFCEVAAALSMLFDKDGESLGWKVEPGWWKRVPKDYVAQIERYCKLCGCAMPLKRRESTDGRDDISKEMLERLKETSPKIKQGKYVEHDKKLLNDTRQMATYKDSNYRNKIAARYGLFLMNNQFGYQTPYLKKDFNLSGGENETKDGTIEDAILCEQKASAE